ncbi:MAG: DNA cytosine methyltransferase [Cyanobacteria bacterium P01_H01_bin.15]
MLLTERLCQSKGLTHPKSTLWREGLRILPQAHPRFFVFEQPVGVRDSSLRAILGGLRIAGYHFEPPQIISAAELGAGHQRDRRGGALTLCFASQLNGMAKFIRSGGTK